MFSIPTTYTFLKKWRGHIFFVLYKKYIYNQKKKTQPPLLFDCGLSVVSQAFLGDTKFYYK